MNNKSMSTANMQFSANCVGRPPLEEPSERDKLILQELDSGKTFQELANQYNITKSRVGQIWERWRETTKIKVKKEKLPTQNILDAIEAYKTGQKVTEIFAQFGISAPTFYKSLRILGQNPARLREKDKGTIPLTNN